MTFTLRPAQPGDAQALAPLAGLLEGEGRTRDLRGRIVGLPPRDHALLVAESARGDLVGWIHVFAAWRMTSEPFAEIGGLAVAPDWRRQGVGRALLAEAERWATRQGCRALRVRVSQARHEAPAFYQAAGFRALKQQAVFSKPV